MDGGGDVDEEDARGWTVLWHGAHGPVAHDLAVEALGIGGDQLRDNLRVEGALVPLSDNLSIVIYKAVQVG